MWHAVRASRQQTIALAGEWTVQRAVESWLVVRSAEEAAEVVLVAMELEEVTAREGRPWQAARACHPWFPA